MYHEDIVLKSTTQQILFFRFSNLNDLPIGEFK